MATRTEELKIIVSMDDKSLKTSEDVKRRILDIDKASQAAGKRLSKNRKKEAAEAKNRLKLIEREHSLNEKATKNQAADNLNRYFSVLGLTFSLMGLSKAVNQFTEGVISSTMAATNFEGPLADADAKLKNVKEVFKLRIGTNEGFIKGISNATDGIESATESIGEFFDSHPKFGEAIGEMTTWINATSPFAMFLGQTFMFLASFGMVMKDVVKAWKWSFGQLGGFMSAANLYITGTLIPAIGRLASTIALALGSIGGLAAVGLGLLASFVGSPLLGATVAAGVLTMFDQPEIDIPQNEQTSSTSTSTGSTYNIEQLNVTSTDEDGNQIFDTLSNWDPLNTTNPATAGNVG